MSTRQYCDRIRSRQIVPGDKTYKVSPFLITEAKSGAEIFSFPGYGEICEKSLEGILKHIRAAFRMKLDTPKAPVSKKGGGKRKKAVDPVTQELVASGASS